MNLLSDSWLAISVVSVFAIIGGALKPKTLAGLFAAAPSVAIATLNLTVLKTR